MDHNHRIKRTLQFGSCLFLISFCFSLFCPIARAQNLFGLPKPQPWPFKPKKVIIFEKKKFPFKFFKLNEKTSVRFLLKDSHDLVTARITRIKSDSVFLNGAGYRFDDLQELRVSPFFLFRKSDSVTWDMIVVPDSVYLSRSSFNKFQQSVLSDYKIKKQKVLTPVFHRNNLKINITKFANLEISIAYERRLTPKWSWESEAGYNFSVGNNRRDDFFLDNFPLWKFEGFNVITGPKYYFRSRWYLEPLLHYRYQQSDSVKTRFPEFGRYILQDQYRNDLGMSIRMGAVTNLSGVVLDTYLGIGIWSMLVHQLAYGYYPDENSSRIVWYNNDHQPVTKDFVKWLPFFSLGLKIGFGF